MLFIAVTLLWLFTRVLGVCWTQLLVTHGLLHIQVSCNYLCLDFHTLKVLPWFLVTCLMDQIQCSSNFSHNYVSWVYHQFGCCLIDWHGCCFLDMNASCNPILALEVMCLGGMTNNATLAICLVIIHVCVKMSSLSWDMLSFILLSKLMNIYLLHLVRNIRDELPVHF